MNFRSKIFKLFVWANKVLVRSQVRDKVLYCRTTAGIVSTASVSQISLTHFRQCKEIRASMQTASVAAVISTHKWVRKIVVILVELCVITHLLAKWNQKKSTISGSSHIKKSPLSLAAVISEKADYLWQQSYQKKPTISGSSHIRKSRLSLAAVISEKSRLSLAAVISKKADYLWQQSYQKKPTISGRLSLAAVCCVAISYCCVAIS